MPNITVTATINNSEPAIKSIGTNGIPTVVAANAAPAPETKLDGVVLGLSE